MFRKTGDAYETQLLPLITKVGGGDAQTGSPNPEQKPAVVGADPAPKAPATETEK